MVRPEKVTTKVRVGFNGSAQQNGKSLNSESLLGSKLQSDIVDILVKFRKEPLALAGGVSQTSQTSGQAPAYILVQELGQWGYTKGL